MLPLLQLLLLQPVNLDAVKTRTAFMAKSIPVNVTKATLEILTPNVYHVDKLLALQRPVELTLFVNKLNHM